MATLQPYSSLLGLPAEIRLKIYDYIFTDPSIVKICNTQPDRVGEQASWEISPIAIGAQILRTCHQVNAEATDRMYHRKIFDCSEREGLKLLLHKIGPKCLSRIKHIILDWEQLQEFGWFLAKSEFKNATQGLRTIQLATWRHRVLGGSSTLWREVKLYEKQLCQAVLDICEKHDHLRKVAQRPYHRPGRWQTASNTSRVKWRILTQDEKLQDDETIIDIEANLSLLLSNIDSGDHDVVVQTITNM